MVDDRGDRGRCDDDDDHLGSRRHHRLDDDGGAGGVRCHKEHPKPFP